MKIGNVEWKVVGCHPGVGVTGKNTQIRCVGAPMTFNPLAKVHILPTAASLRVVMSP